MIKNILWDLDGTLFDTYPATTYALNETLKELGFSMPLNAIDGLARQSIRRCLGTLSQRFDLNPELLQRRFTDTYQGVSAANQLPFPGVRSVCEWIRARGGVNIIIAHRSLKSTLKLLEAHNLSPLFEDIFTAEQGYPRKPDPAMILAALGKHHLNPDETLLVGDRELDVQAGQAAYVRTCLFGRVVESASPDYQIENYKQLSKILLALDPKEITPEWRI